MQSLKNLRFKQRKLEKSYNLFLKKRDKVFKKNSHYFFIYSDFKKKFPSFCPLYKNNEICHNIDKDIFDCWNCYFPYYDYRHIDAEKGLVGRCKKYHNKGKYTNKTWDCSNCSDIHSY